MRRYQACEACEELCTKKEHVQKSLGRNKFVMSEDLQEDHGGWSRMNEGSGRR